MKKIIIIGGSKGIGKPLQKSLLTHTKLSIISRSTPIFNTKFNPLSHCDVLSDELPEIERLMVYILSRKYKSKAV